MYSQTRDRGRGINKRTWGIEMNESRKLYLTTYGTIDRMDHLIQNCDMHYRSWKYWHSAMIHAKSMAIVVAYDIYKEVCKGTLDPALRIKPVDFH